MTKWKLESLLLMLRLPFRKSIAADMAEWELFSWQFTTYGPIPSRRSIPGIDDLSPEEVRYSFLSNGNQFPPHLNLEMRLKQIQEFRRDWSHPHLTPQHINLIVSLEGSGHMGMMCSIFIPNFHFYSFALELPAGEAGATGVQEQY